MANEGSARANRPRSLARGEPAPWFRATSLGGNPNFALERMGGRHILMLFFGSAERPGVSEALALVNQHRAMFDDENCSFFGVTVEPSDEAEDRITPQMPGIRYFLDYDRKISRLYGAALPKTYRPHWVVLDPTLRVLGVYPLSDGEQAFRTLKDEMEGLPEDQWAPVLCVPNVFEPDLCRELISRYEADGGTESGLMHDVDGKTVLTTNEKFKQRRDWLIDDVRLCNALRVRISRRLAVPVERAFRFPPTRVERYMVSCYEAGHGHFKAHRDNGAKATEHRVFAVTLNLNDDYEGGDLRFPEFGKRTYRAPVGGAIVFSCSLLHEAMPVTSGKRYVFIPFLYDEAGEAMRQRYLASVKARAPSAVA